MCNAHTWPLYAWSCQLQEKSVAFVCICLAKCRNICGLFSLQLFFYAKGMVPWWHIGNTCLPLLKSGLKSLPGLIEEASSFAIGQQFVIQNLDQLCVMVSSSLPTDHQNTINNVLGVNTFIIEVYKFHVFSCFHKISLYLFSFNLCDKFI